MGVKVGMNLTKIDYLTFRSQAQPLECLEACRDVFGESGALLSGKHNQRGWNGFEQSQKLCVGDMPVGFIAYGGEPMRGWVRVEITGNGCGWVDDWDTSEQTFSELTSFEKRRVDICLDTHKREVTHESVLTAYRAGLFTTCGSPPSMTKIEPEGAEEGKTIYVGKRNQPKFFRGYEKGYQIAQKYPGIDLTHIDGNPIGDMYRLEVELKAKNAPLPDDLILNRDQYFAGAYPYLQNVLKVEPEMFKMSREESPKMALKARLAMIQNQYGPTLFTALAAHGGDIGAVWAQICGTEHSKTLLEEGVLLVQHD